MLYVIISYMIHMIYIYDTYDIYMIYIMDSSPSECQIFHLFRCVLSYVLPLRSVGRSNFVRVCINLTLIQKRHILM